MENARRYCPLPNKLHTGKNRFKNQVEFCKTYPSADCDSDHNITIAKCELRYKKPQRTKV